MLSWFPKDRGCLHRYKNIAYGYEIAVPLSILLIKMMMYFCMEKECIGFYGEECSIPCPAGFYGRQCKTPCNCSSNEACNQFVGCRSNSTCGKIF